MKIINSILVFIIVITFSLSSQEKDNDINSEDNVLKFANYLFDSGEYYRAANEYERYLFIKNTAIDSINYKIGFCLFLDNQIDKSLPIFEQIIKESNDDSIKSISLFHSVYAQTKLNSPEKSLNILNNNQQILSKQNKSIEKINFVLLADNLLLKNWEESKSILNNISNSDEYADSKESFNQLLKRGTGLKEKNPYFAAGLSSIIPGLGKVYSGNTIDGIFTFLLLGFTTWQSYDGFSDDGTSSIKGWLFSGIGTVFYIGNIYGSFVAVKIMNKEINDEYNTQIHIELRKTIGY